MKRDSASVPPAENGQNINVVPLSGGEVSWMCCGMPREFSCQHELPGKKRANKDEQGEGTE